MPKRKESSPDETKSKREESKKKAKRYQDQLRRKSGRMSAGMLDHKELSVTDSSTQISKKSRVSEGFISKLSPSPSLDDFRASRWKAQEWAEKNLNGNMEGEEMEGEEEEKVDMEEMRVLTAPSEKPSPSVLTFVPAVSSVSHTDNRPLCPMPYVDTGLPEDFSVESLSTVTASTPQRPFAQRESILTRVRQKTLEQPNGNIPADSTVTSPGQACKLPQSPSRVLSPRTPVNASSLSSVSPDRPSTEILQQSPLPADSGSAVSSSGALGLSVHDWVKTPLLAMAPLLLSAATLCIVAPAWPLVCPHLSAASQVLSSVPGYAVGWGGRVQSLVPELLRSGGQGRTGRKVCFTSSRGIGVTASGGGGLGDQSAMSGFNLPPGCKEGMDVAPCPPAAVCSSGSILSCDVPFDLSPRGDDCIMSLELRQELSVVVDFLREKTVVDQCGGGLFAPIADKSEVTLAEVEEAGTMRFSLLPSLMSGGVLSDTLELAPLKEEGGDDGAELDPDAGVGGGEVRVRLSDAEAKDVDLPFVCKVRLWMMLSVQAHWKVLMGLFIMLVLVLWMDFRRLSYYNLHKKVCTTRDLAYKALLDHAASSESPMQVPHIQDFVLDQQRGRGASSASQKRYMKQALWPLVDEEVASDSRIRRSYKNIRGQNNIMCWEWLGPKTTTFDSIGALDPGPPPRLLLLRV